MDIIQFLLQPPIFTFDGDSKEMQRAHKNAQTTFQYFWRELSWENRRATPLFDIAAVKVAFENPSTCGPSHEHMWLDEIQFDGTILTGNLLNNPEWVKLLKLQKRVKFSLDQISDWMYAVKGKVYGAFTVNLMREHMAGSERRHHDSAWGVNFGPPQVIELFYYRERPRRALFPLFKKTQPLTDRQLMEEEHPMSLQMIDSFKEQLLHSNDLIELKDSNGNTALHSESLAGNALFVELLLKHGANPQERNKQGKTPLDLAQVFDWPKVNELLGTPK